MWNQYTKTTHLHFIENTGSDDIFGEQKDLPWNSLLELLTTHDIRQDKEGALFIPVTWKKNEDLITNAKGSYRIDENVEFINLTVLDLDKPGALHQATRVFADFDYVIYSTHSYTKDTPYKARIAIRHEDPIPAEQLNDYMFNLAHCVDLDSACKNKSRAFYLPSISKTAGISPLVMVNNGRGIKFEDSIILRETKAKERTKEELNALKRNFNQIEYKSASGSSGSNFSTGSDSINSSKSSFDYDDMLVEYSGIIKSKLRFEDSRFQFSRAVIWHAVKVNGASVDWHNVVQFLHQVTLTEGTKQFHHGNTRDELDGMIRTTLQKVIPDYLAEHPTYADETIATVYKAVNIAERSMNTKKWQYNENSIKRQVSNGEISKKEDFSYESLTERNKSSDFHLVRNDDVVGYIIDVFKNELGLKGNNVDINTVGQFALYRASKYLKKQNESISVYKDSLFTDVTIAEIDPSNKLKGEDRDSMSRFLQTSLKLGYLSAINKRNFDLTRSKTQEASLAP